MPQDLYPKFIACAKLTRRSMVCKRLTATASVGREAGGMLSVVAAASTGVVVVVVVVTAVRWLLPGSTLTLRHTWARERDTVAVEDCRRRSIKHVFILFIARSLKLMSIFVAVVVFTSL